MVVRRTRRHWLLGLIARVAELVVALRVRHGEAGTQQLRAVGEEVAPDAEVVERQLVPPDEEVVEQQLVPPDAEVAVQSVL